MNILLMKQYFHLKKEMLTFSENIFIFKIMFSIILTTGALRQLPAADGKQQLKSPTARVVSFMYPTHDQC